MKNIKLILLSFIMLANLSFLHAQDRKVARAGDDESSLSGIVMPQEKQVNIELLVAKILERYHYRETELNDSLSSAILDNYLSSLDNNKVYFLASDIQNFEQYRHSLDDDLKNGNLVPAYHIYNIFKQRFKQRNDHIKSLLKKEFDFTKDEYIETEREDAAWAKSPEELDEVWRKIIKSQALDLKLAGKEWSEVVETLKNRYENLENAVAEYNSEDVFQTYMNAFTESYDPHTNYFSQATSDNFDISMSQSLEGIGARLQRDNDYTKIAELIPGGPAYKSKLLHPNDRIIGVAQGNNGEIVDVIGWRLDEVVKLIRGPKGTVVRLQILPGASGINAIPVEVTLTRDKIKLEEQAASKEILEIKHNNKDYRMGVITIPMFYMDFEAAQRGDENYRSTTRDVKKLIAELQTENIDGLIIDLRYNGGGSLPEAIELSGLFIEDGPVVQVKNADGSVEVATDPDPEQFYEGPLAVLTNRFSASASEIFAGAIQDYNRGIVIGEQSYGKGTVQNLLDLDRFLPGDNKAGKVKVTLAKFYRVTGSSTQHRGVSPDIALPSAFSGKEFGESSQPSALPWDQIAPTKFEEYHYVTDELVAKLNKSYENRLATEDELKGLVRDMKELEEARAKTKQSLQESKRMQERENAEELRAARANLGSTINTSEVDSEEVKEEVVEEKDPYLNEGAKILADMITYVG